MLVTRALKRRNGTHTKRNIFNGAYNDIWDAIFTFIDNLEYILYFSKKPHHLVGLPNRLNDGVGSRHALLLQSLVMCFSLISFYLRDFWILEF